MIVEDVVQQEIKNITKLSINTKLESKVTH